MTTADTRATVPASRTLWGVARRLIGPVLTLSITLSALAIVRRLWNASWSVPFVYSGDGIATGMHARDLLRGPNYLYNPYLGWPDSQHLADIPQGADNFHFGAMWLIGLFTDSFGVVLNTYFIATFALVALASYAAFRLLRISVPASVFAAVAFTFLPYHFARGESHLFLSGYFMVPFAMVVLLWQLNPDHCLVRAQGGTQETPSPSWRRVLPIATCLVLGTTGAYYAFFFILLLVPACALFALLKRSWRIAISGAVCVALTVASIVANIAPTLAYWAQNGANNAFDRAVGENEVYGLKIAQLFLPIPGHRLDALAELSERSLRVPLFSESGQQLGAIAACGVLFVVGFAIVRIVRRTSPSPLEGTLAEMSVVTMIALLVSTMGGFSTILALGGFDSIRVYSRIAVVLGFIGIAVVAIGVDRLSERAAARQRPLFLGVIAGALLLFAILDQTPKGTPNYEVTTAEFRSDKAFVEAVEASLPESAAVFQLPILPFPEAPTPGRMQDYDPLRGVLHSRNLRFSYGAVKGRDDWQLRLQGLPTPSLVDAIYSIGFKAIWVDRFGYTDNGRRLEMSLTQLLGRPTVESENGRFVVFSLSQAEKDGALQLLPKNLARSPFAHSASGFGAIQQSGDDTVYTAFAPTSAFGFINSAGTTRRATARFGLASSSRSGGRLTLMFLGQKVELDLGPLEQNCELAFDAPPGQSTLKLTFAGPGADVPPLPGFPSAGSAPYFRLINVQVFDARQDRPVATIPAVSCK